MSSTETVVIGAGHAGLAVSRLLTGAGRDHVVLDRGRVGESWRSERWDSLHLLTPNWMTRLPGWWYAGPDPDAYMSAGRFVRHLERYAGFFGAPVLTGTTVHEVAATDDGYRVRTDGDTWQARHVVVATGPHGTPYVPDGLARRDLGVEVVTANDYRSPDRIAPGGVLVVGASSSGVQIADELARAGRRVVLAVGRHTRMPRRYRGMDAFWWLDATGRMSRTIDTVADPVAARREPSLQLVGRNDPEQYGEDLDLGTLQDRGVRLVGRVLDADGGTVHLGDGLAENVASADRSMHRVLDAVDAYVERTGLTREVWAPVRPKPVALPPAPVRLDLRAEGIGTVLVAAGYRPDHSWLRVPVTGPDGHIRQQRGVTPAPGLYVVGQRFQHRRDSGLIAGARHDAWTVARHLIRGPGALAGRPSREPAA